MPEITEEELAALRRTASAVGSLMKNPKARKFLAQAQKTVNPDDPLAKEADEVDPIEARFAEMEKQLAESQKKIDEDKADRERNAKLGELHKLRADGLAQLRRDRWTDDGIKKVEELMESKGILDPLDAAAIYERDHPPQAPVVPNSSARWDFLTQPAEGDADIKALIESKGQNEQLVDRMVQGAISDARSGGLQPARR